jgi:hypothetical protein
MKKVLYTLTLALIATACSTPKYSYHFDHYDYNSGRKNSVTTTSADNKVQEVSPLVLETQEVVASSSEAAPAPSLSTEQKQALVQKITSMTKEERKDLKQALKSQLKKKSNEKKALEGNSVNEKKAWDYDLKMAAIFGAIGIVLTALGGVNTVFWVLGAIALVVGIIFLIKWLARQ